PRVFHPVTDGRTLFVQDSKVVCAIDPASAKLRWLYVASDPQDARTEEPLLPGQLANPAFRPTLDQGHVYATLDRNTPPIYDPEAPAAEKGQQQTAERARDWRVVCLDAKSGRLRWDAAESEGLVELLRGARHVSPPLVAHGQVYLVVLTEKAGDLSAYAVALDAATGALNFQAFVASRSPSDFLRQAAIAPAPTAAQGRIILQTGLSLIAAVDPHTGATAWANAFPTPPLENEQRIVERGHRFALTSPRLVGEVLIVAPQSSVALLGLDPATGRSVFRVSRGPLTHLCGTTAEGFVLAGSDRRGGTIVQGYDARNGRTRWQTRIREGRLAGHPFATREHVYVPTGDAVTTLSAQTGRPVASAITLSRGASQSGNILATPFGIVLTHASGLTVLEDRAASRQRLERAYRAQPSPEAALTWGSFLGRTGELDAALNVLDAGRAGVGAGSDAARALEEAAYDLARREARRLDADGQNEAALTAWIRASRYAGDLPRAAGDLAALAQKLVDSARLQDAATVLGRLSGLGEASLTIESASEHVLARTWARLRLQELRATDGGPEALAAFDREAAEALAAIRGQLNPEPLQSLAERYPTSPAEADALLLTADLFERQGLPNVAAQYLRDRLNRFPERRDTKDLLLRRARLLERTLRYTEAVADYRLLRDHFGSARVMDDPRELSELADERLRALAPLVSDPSFQTPTGAGDELGLVFQTRTDLENPDPVVFSPAGLDPETARVFLVLGEQSLEGRLVETGLVKWRLKFTEPPRKEHVVAADPSTIVLYADSTLLALDLTSGEIRWRAALDEIAPPPAAELTPPPGEGEEPSEDELEPEEDVDDLA
ncbi:MAG: outer membrane protein assembly factor BamB family protein, partial [Planctomycetota bacterium]